MCYHAAMSVGRDISRLSRYCPDPASIGALHRTVYAGASQGWGMVGPTLAKNGHNNASSSYNMSLCDLETRMGGAIAVCGPLQRRSDPADPPREFASRSVVVVVVVWHGLGALTSYTFTCRSLRTSGASHRLGQGPAAAGRATPIKLRRTVRWLPTFRVTGV